MLESHLPVPRPAKCSRADGHRERHRRAGEQPGLVKQRLAGRTQRQPRQVQHEHQQAGEERQVGGPVEPAAEEPPERSEGLAGPGVDAAFAAEPAGQLRRRQRQRHGKRQHRDHPERQRRRPARRRDADPADRKRHRGGVEEQVGEAERARSSQLRSPSPAPFPPQITTNNRAPFAPPPPRRRRQRRLAAQSRRDSLRAAARQSEGGKGAQAHTSPSRDCPQMAPQSIRKLRRPAAARGRRAGLSRRSSQSECGRGRKATPTSRAGIRPAPVDRNPPLISVPPLTPRLAEQRRLQLADRGRRRPVHPCRLSFLELVRRRHSGGDPSLPIASGPFTTLLFVICQNLTGPKLRSVARPAQTTLAA